MNMAYVGSPGLEPKGRRIRITTTVAPTSSKKIKEVTSSYGFSLSTLLDAICVTGKLDEVAKILSA